MPEIFLFSSFVFFEDFDMAWIKMNFIYCTSFTFKVEGTRLSDQSRIGVEKGQKHLCETSKISKTSKVAKHVNFSEI